MPNLGVDGLKLGKVFPRLKFSYIKLVIINAMAKLYMLAAPDNSRKRNAIKIQFL